MNNSKRYFMVFIGFILATSLFYIPVGAQDSKQTEFREVLRLGRGTANDMAWQPDEQSLVVGGSLGLWFYDNDFNEIGYLEMAPWIMSLAWNPDGSRLAVGSKDGQLQIWAISIIEQGVSGELLNTIDIFTAAVEEVEWDSSGNFVAGVSDNEAIVLNPDTGEYNIVFSEAEGVSDVQLGAISWHPNEATIAIATQNAVLLWDAETNQQINSLPSSMLVKWLSPYLLLTASDNMFQIRDLRADSIARTIEPNFQLDRLNGFIANERYLATTFFWREEVYLTDLATGTELSPLTGTDFNLSSLEWNPSGTRIAAISSGNISSILVWNLESGGLEHEYKEFNKGYSRLLLSPDGSRIAAQTGHEVEVWDIASEAIIARLPNVTGPAAWSPDGSRIATSNNNSSLLIWDASTGNLLATHQGADLGIMVLETTYSIAWSEPDHIMTAGGALVVWDVNSDVLPEVEDCHPWADIGFWWSPDQTRIAVRAWDSTQVWICNRQFERILSFEGYTTVAWSPDGSEIATVGIENTLRIWDTTYGEAVLTSGGNKIIRYIAWSPGGTQIAIGYLDGELQVLTRAALSYLTLTSDIHVDGLSDIVWTDEVLITASNKGIIQIWRIN